MGNEEVGDQNPPGLFSCFFLHREFYYLIIFIIRMPIALFCCHCSWGQLRVSRAKMLLVFRSVRDIVRENFSCNELLIDLKVSDLWISEHVQLLIQ